MMTRHQGWVCENGHRIPSRTTVTCPECGVRRDVEPARPGAGKAAGARRTIVLLLVGAAACFFVSRTIAYTAVVPDSVSDLTLSGGRQMAADLAYVLNLAGLGLALAAIVALGVRLGIEAARD